MEEGRFNLNYGDFGGFSWRVDTALDIQPMVVESCGITTKDSSKPQNLS